jgi:hypothetical protein
MLAVSIQPSEDSKDVWFGAPEPFLNHFGKASLRIEGVAARSLVADLTGKLKAEC